MEERYLPTTPATRVDIGRGITFTEPDGTRHEWLTVEELAERYRRSAHTIRRWLRDGKFGSAAEKTPAGGWLVRADAGKPDAKTGAKGF